MPETVLVPKISTLAMQYAFEAEVKKIEDCLAKGGMIFETVIAHALDAAIRAGATEISAPPNDQTRPHR